MKKITLLLFLICSMTFASAQVISNLLDVTPDSAFRGEHLDVTVTYPNAFVFINASPGEYIHFSNSSLGSFDSWGLSAQIVGPVLTYGVDVPLTAAPGIYDVSAYSGHYDNSGWPPWGAFVIDTTYIMPQAFMVVQTNVYGRIFIDRNSNGVLEPWLGERYWGNKRIDISPDSISTYTDRNGYFLLTLPPGTHTVQYHLEPGESITTGNSPVTFNVTSTSVHPLGSIGVHTTANTYYINATAWIGGRCNSYWTGYIYVQNFSDTAVRADVTLNLSPNITFISADPVPGSVTGNTISWNLGYIDPGQYQTIRVNYHLPGGGSAFSYDVSMTAYNGTQAVDSVDLHNTGTVTCSFDPNDKSVNPEGLTFAHYTLIGEDLYYHINFQNTGNDTAFNVVVRDTLDADLDLNTFTFLGSSSPAIVKLDYQTRIVEFIMNNILLPDSNVNEPGSHGYVDYKINHIAGILDGTEITNTAYIYFDLNPPVETNTTLNTMLSFVPVGITDAIFGSGVNVYPNPFSQDAQIVISNWKGEVSTLKIWNELGELQITKEIHSDHYILSGADLTSGIYFYRLESKSQSRSGKFVYTGK